jgi:hypothetical protein
LTKETPLAPALASPPLSVVSPLRPLAAANKRPSTKGRAFSQVPYVVNPTIKREEKVASKATGIAVLFSWLYAHKGVDPVIRVLSQWWNVL